MKLSLFCRGPVNLFLSILIVFISFSIATPARAAFSGSIYPDVTIAPGGSATLYTPVSGGTFPYDCTLSGTDGSSKQYRIVNGQQSFGPFIVSPNQTTTYTLACQDAAGAQLNDPATITVSSTPVIFTLKADPNTLPTGGGITSIETGVSLAISCMPTDGTPEWRALKNLQGDGKNTQYNSVGNVTQTTTFSLECTNTTGASSGKKSLTVYVGTTENCGNGVKEPDFNEECDEGSDKNGLCPAVCSLTCKQNSCGGEAVINLTASDYNVKIGNSVILKWTTSKAVSCQLNGSNGLEPIPIAGTSEVYPELGAQGKFSYTVYCLDSSGRTAQKSVWIEVETDRPTVEYTTANPLIVPYSVSGMSVTLNWTSVNTGYCKTIPNLLIQSGPDYENPRFNVETNGSITYQNVQSGPKKAKIYCSNPLGTQSDQDEINIYIESSPTATPTVKLYVGSEKSLNYQTKPGTSFDLYFEMYGAERCEFTDSTRGGSTAYTPFIGVQKKVKSVTVDTDYTLECWNGDRSSKSLVTVAVGTPPPPPPMPGTPTPPGFPTPGGDGSCLSPNVCITGGCPTDKYTPGNGTCSDTGLSCCTPLALPSPGVGYFNPLKYNSVDSVLTAVLSTLQSIVVTLSIIMIIVGAVMYILSAGNESRVTQAKVAITAAMVGLALAIAAPAFLKEIGELLGWIEVTQVVDEAQSFTQIATKVLNFLLSIVGIIGIIMLVIGGLMYLTAGGDEGKAETGKKITTYAIIAIAIALSALVLVTQVAKFFG